MAFEPFGKIARLNRDVIISEKLDGTNALVEIGQWPNGRDVELPDQENIIASANGLFMLAGSRTRYITPGKTTDNFGFAAWVQTNADQLWTLGPGKHYGEWFGQGIQRGYGLKEKRFALFNVSRWTDAAVRPACCHVVPTLLTGPFTTEMTNMAVAMLRLNGSYAVSAFTPAEGIVIYHTASKQLYKVTLDGDGVPKSRR